MSQQKSDWAAWIIEAKYEPSNEVAIEAMAKEMTGYFLSNEPQMTHFEWSVNSERGHLILHERYATSQAGLAHIKAFSDKFAEQFSALVAPQRVVVFGNPSQELLDVLSGMSPEILRYLAGFSR